MQVSGHPLGPALPPEWEKSLLLLNRLSSKEWGVFLLLFLSESVSKSFLCVFSKQKQKQGFQGPGEVGFRGMHFKLVVGPQPEILPDLLRISQQCHMPRLYPVAEGAVESGGGSSSLSSMANLSPSMRQHCCAVIEPVAYVCRVTILSR